ncbi:DUF1289 domain-containing protein [Halomonas daqiaonensis]|uniref:DUF1289 domain-containing protein n=1 Tax=Halomonas daqiaonensis TaxID=650850 RepID=A0A1H7FZD5_9GAMM|nr:DUF1289 domain-containing protein [Halomonas daqiaonensis]SEK31261.1 hypothetical protein SAMN04488129_101241 [Halomonas daqiaonensis]
MRERITSPCVGLCSTTLGDRVCRGCQRIDSEIRDWPALSGEQRHRCMVELDRLRAEVAGRYLVVVDPDSLEAQLRRHRIRYRDAQPPLSRAVELLRVGRGRIRDLSRYGLAGRDEGDVTTLHGRITADLLAAAERRQAVLPAPLDLPTLDP